MVFVRGAQTSAKETEKRAPHIQISLAQSESKPAIISHFPSSKTRGSKIPKSMQANNYFPFYPLQKPGVQIPKSIQANNYVPIALYKNQGFNSPNKSKPTMIAHLPSTEPGVTN